jgi:hypothetical protein
MGGRTLMTDASDDPRDDPRFHLLTALLDACEESGLDLDAQLRALTIVWVERAQRLRGEALALSDGYVAEKGASARNPRGNDGRDHRRSAGSRSGTVVSGGRYRWGVGAFAACAGAASVSGDAGRLFLSE